MTSEELDRIKRAEEIQRYTENRCEALEKENADLKIYNEKLLDGDIEKHNKIVALETENAELKKEVEKHKWNNIFLEDCACYDKKIAEEYTTSQERIAELETMVEKMKCCGNCHYFNSSKDIGIGNLFCDLMLIKKEYCKNKDHWKFYKEEENDR